MRPGVAMVFSAGLALASCGDDPSPEEEREALVDELAGDLVSESDGALDEDQARCVAGRLADDIGVERFDQVVAAARDGDDADPDLRAQVIDAFAACEALEPLFERR